MNQVKLKRQIKNFFINIFTIKNIIIKILCILFSIIIVIIPAFIIRDFILKSSIQNKELIPNFLNINITYNTGVGFSFGSHWEPNIVMTMQIFFSLVPLTIFIFSKNIYYILSTNFMFMGALCNIIDRAMDDQFTTLFNGKIIQNAVVDYLEFSFFSKMGIFNWADIFINLGFIIFIISFIIIFIKEIINYNKRDKNERYKNK